MVAALTSLRSATRLIPPLFAVGAATTACAFESASELFNPALALQMSLVVLAVALMPTVPTFQLISSIRLFIVYAFPVFAFHSILLHFLSLATLLPARAEDMADSW